MNFLNYSSLASTPAREAVLKILDAGLESIDTHEVVPRAFEIHGDSVSLGGQTISLESGKIFLVSIGKCGLEAAQEIVEVLGKRIHKGIVIDVQEGRVDHPGIHVFAGDHPFPSERNVSATRKMMDLLAETQENDTVLAAISGGGSSLLCQPENLTCHEEKQIVECLFRAGAPIEDINVVRKHLSLAKGGFLAKYAYPAKVFGLIFSDVPGNDLEFVASGPTVRDTTTVEDAQKVLEKYRVEGECVFAKEGLIETPKEEKYFSKVHNMLLVSNEIALQAMKREAESLGFRAEIRTSAFSGQARHVGSGVAEDLGSVPPNTVLLYGGESTVILKGPGKGGRNLEVALSALRFLGDGDIVASLASDGRDNGPYAGGLCDILTKQKAEEQNMDPKEFLNRNDSLNFFESVGDFLDTGDTGSNVSDLIIALRTKDDESK